MTREDRVRLFDPIRIILTALVIIHHTAITYGGSGSWYYKEDGAPELTQRLLTIVTAVDQSFLMGFFFRWPDTSPRHRGRAKVNPPILATACGA